jgi:G3E family GTPase
MRRRFYNAPYVRTKLHCRRDHTVNEAAQRIPISILTGFLGSGKTTVLSRLLAHPQMQRTAVLVNEFGALGIDDVLLRTVTDNVVLLESGCICCTIGDNLTRRLLELLGQRETGVIPPFDRAIIETTGLADPAPLMQGFMLEPLASAPFRLAAVIATVDALEGARQLDRHTESVKQAALADRILVTKIDLAAPEQVDALVVRLQEVNRAAPLYRIARGQIEPDLILDAGLWNAQKRCIDLERWLNAPISTERTYVRRHDMRIETSCLAWDPPVRFERFTDAVDTLMSTHGDDLLRMKGILAVEGAAGPVVVHGVQRLFYPPVRLPSWPTSDRRCRLVFITRGIPRATIEASFMLLAGGNGAQAETL